MADPIYGQVLYTTTGQVGIPLDQDGNPQCMCEFHLKPRISPIPKWEWVPSCFLHRNWEALAADRGEENCHPAEGS